MRSATEGILAVARRRSRPARRRSRWPNLAPGRRRDGRPCIATSAGRRELLEALYTDGSRAHRGGGTSRATPPAEIRRVAGAFSCVLGGQAPWSRTSCGKRRGRGAMLADSAPAGAGGRRRAADRRSGSGEVRDDLTLRADPRHDQRPSPGSRATRVRRAAPLDALAGLRPLLDDRACPAFRPRVAGDGAVERVGCLGLRLVENVDNAAVAGPLAARMTPLPVTAMS